MKVGHSDLCPVPHFRWTSQSWKGQGLPKDVATPRPTPCSRIQHACSLLGGYVYLFGGKDGYSPLKDLWRMDLESGEWEMVQFPDTKMPHLQGHTMLAFQSQIFVFGGTFEESHDDIPLWIYSPDLKHIRKYVCDTHLARPTGRREHTCVLYKSSMYVYGGFIDSSGSTDEFWSFDLKEEEWSALPRPKAGRRHGHVCMVHRHTMWVHGGMKGLDNLADLWLYNFTMCTWKKIKGNGVCPALSDHTGHAMDNNLILVGGSCCSSPSSSIWLYGIDNNTWCQVAVDQSHLFTPVFLHSSLLINPKTTTFTKDKHSQSTPHLKSHNSQAATPSVRPWTSPSLMEGVNQSAFDTQQRNSETNVLRLDKNNNSEENLFSSTQVGFESEDLSHYKWQEFKDCKSRNESNILSSSHCESFEMVDMSKGIQHPCPNGAKIYPASREHCHDDQPLLERFHSIGSDVDLGETNTVVSLSDENLSRVTAQKLEHDKSYFQYDNPAFLPVLKNDGSGLEYKHNGEHINPIDNAALNLFNKRANFTSNSSLVSNDVFEEAFSNSSVKYTVDEKKVFTCRSTSSYQENEKARMVGDHEGLCKFPSDFVNHDMKLCPSLNDLVVEDLDFGDDESTFKDLIVASPTVTLSKCSSLTDNLHVSPSIMDDDIFSSHPFCANLPTEVRSRSCSFLNDLGVKSKRLYGSLNRMDSLFDFLIFGAKSREKKLGGGDVNVVRTGKYLKHRVVNTQGNLSGKLHAHNGNSNIPKLIKSRKSAATQTSNSQISLATNKDSVDAINLGKLLNGEGNRVTVSSSCKLQDKNQDSNHRDARLTLFSDCSFVLFVLGGQTENPSFVKTPLKIWKCKIS